jgi:hypothetical protein
MTARLVARCLEYQCRWSYLNTRHDNQAFEHALIHNLETDHDLQVVREDDGLPDPPRRGAVMFGGR